MKGLSLENRETNAKWRKEDDQNPKTERNIFLLRNREETNTTRAYKQRRTWLKMNLQGFVGSPAVPTEDNKCHPIDGGEPLESLKG